jgi:hypothetical protein
MLSTYDEIDCKIHQMLISQANVFVRTFCLLVVI